MSKSVSPKPTLRLRISGRNVGLFFLDGKTDPDLEDKNSGVAMLGRNGEPCIKIDQNCCPSIQQETLCHELLHFVNHDTASRMKEEEVSRVSTNFWTIFRDNPKLQRLVFGKGLEGAEP